MEAPEQPTIQSIDLDENPETAVDYTASRTAAARRRLHFTKISAAQMLARGFKPSVVAAELQISVTTINRWLADTEFLATVEDYSSRIDVAFAAAAEKLKHVVGDVAEVMINDIVLNPSAPLQLRGKLALELFDRVAELSAAYSRQDLGTGAKTFESQLKTVKLNPDGSSK